VTPGDRVRRSGSGLVGTVLTVTAVACTVDWDDLGPRMVFADDLLIVS
jgi:hypothetical protein